MFNQFSKPLSKNLGSFSKMYVNLWHFIITCLALFTACQLSAATLTVSDNLVVRDLDDVAIKKSFFSKKSEFELSPGAHTLVLKYKDVFEDIDFAEDKIIKSEFFVVKFTLEDQQGIFLSTSEINDLAEAERFVRAPILIMLDNHQQELVLDLQSLDEYVLAKQVAKQLGDVPHSVKNNSTLKTKVRKQVSAPQAPLANKVPSKKLSSDAKQLQNNTISPNELDKVDAIPMLKYWWRKASESEKKAFLEFVNEAI